MESSSSAASSRLEQMNRGLTEMARITDQDELLGIACEVAAGSAAFERVMLSRVEEGEWRPWRSYAATMGPAERSFGEWLAGAPCIPLSTKLLESELVRRREPLLVVDAGSDPRVHRPLAEKSELTSYVAAPIIAGDRVIGLLHADNRGLAVDELDRMILWCFAIGLGQIFEHTVLAARLRDQRVEMAQSLRDIEAGLDALAAREVDLTTREDQSTTIDAPVQTEVRPPTALARLLTERELEVLALMATGATNERIAQRLVIATGTVKSHVKQILRKLRVGNRAEAISQYLRLTVRAHED